MENYQKEYETTVEINGVEQVVRVECGYDFSTGEAWAAFYDDDGEEVEVSIVDEELAQETALEAAGDWFESNRY